jgi:hypothetical protein
MSYRNGGLGQRLNYERHSFPFPTLDYKAVHWYRIPHANYPSGDISLAFTKALAALL